MTFSRQRAGNHLYPERESVATLSLGTKTSWMKDDERQERTEWHRIQAWAKLAEYAAGLKKDAHLRVARELRSREYETDAGVKVRTYVIVASSSVNLRPGQRTSMSESESDQATAPADDVLATNVQTALFPFGRFVDHGRTSAPVQ